MVCTDNVYQLFERIHTLNICDKMDSTEIYAKYISHHSYPTHGIW